MITGTTNLAPEVIEAYNEAYKAAIKLLPERAWGKELDVKLLHDLDVTELQQSLNLKSKVIARFEEDNRVARIYQTVPSALDLLRFTDLSKKMLTELNECIDDFKAQIMNEINLNMPKSVLVRYNLKKALDFCTPKRITIKVIEESDPAKIVKGMIEEMIDSELTKNSLNRSELQLKDLEKRNLYLLLCRKFIEQEVALHFDKDVRLSDREARVIDNKEVENALSVINIGINSEDCKLKVSSILTLKNSSHAKISREVSSEMVPRVIKYKGESKIKNLLRIKDLLATTALRG